MLTVDQHAKIRQLRRDQRTIRQIAQELHHSPKTILKALAQPEPVPQPAEPRDAPVFGSFRGLVDHILDADEDAPRKQRHTAMQIYRRLVAEHGYCGGYDQVRRHVQQRRRHQRPTFIPLDHRPGVRAEADFGHIHVDFPDGRRQVPVLLVTWSYSNAPFAIALPTERTEAVLHGLVEAFRFFDCVPTELWWDNPTTVALHILKGRERTLHPRYAALASHYPFTPKFCMPATATEKPRVENRVYDLQRQWATPVPQVPNLDALNGHLLNCCRVARERTCGDQRDTVGVRFEHDRAAALTIPERPFDACIVQTAEVDKYQTIRFDDNRYSVPRRWAFRVVTIKGYVDRVVLVADGEIVASHPRSYSRREKVLDPLHFLSVLHTKPAALDHAPVYRDWQLPAGFSRLRQSLETRLGQATGSRQYIRVLQLLAHHSLDRVAAAIDRALTGKADAQAIVADVERLVAGADASVAVPTALARVSVPTPDLSRFDRLLSRFPGDADDRYDAAVVANQPQTTQAAGDAGRVGEARP